MSWSEFWAMGGYGLYVWGSYGAAALVLVYNLLAARHREKAVRRQLQNLARYERASDE
jgi:heme exporter protein D